MCAIKKLQTNEQPIDSHFATQHIVSCRDDELTRPYWNFRPQATKHPPFAKQDLLELEFEDGMFLLEKEYIHIFAIMKFGSYQQLLQVRNEIASN